MLTSHVKACAEAKITGFKQAPEELWKRVEEHANACNIPQVGTYENFAFTAFQLNIAPAVKLSMRQ